MRLSAAGAQTWTATGLAVPSRRIQGMRSPDQCPSCVLHMMARSCDQIDHAMGHHPPYFRQTPSTAEFKADEPLGGSNYTGFCRWQTFLPMDPPESKTDATPSHVAHFKPLYAYSILITCVGIGVMASHCVCCVYSGAMARLLCLTANPTRSSSASCCASPSLDFNFIAVSYSCLMGSQWSSPASIRHCVVARACCGVTD